jgi:hypothetical protein
MEIVSSFLATTALSPTVFSISSVSALILVATGKSGVLPGIAIRQKVIVTTFGKQSD